MVYLKHDRDIPFWLETLDILISVTLVGIGMYLDLVLFLVITTFSGGVTSVIAEVVCEL